MAASQGQEQTPLEYWIDYGIPDKEGPHKGEHKGLCGMKMPVNYVVEMYIDRVAASKNYQKEKYRDDSALAYYMNGRQFHVLHDDTRALLELLLEMLAIKGKKQRTALSGKRFSPIKSRMRKNRYCN